MNNLETLTTWGTHDTGRRQTKGQSRMNNLETLATWGTHDTGRRPLFVFVLCRVYPMWPVSLDCSFLTTPLFVFVLCRVYPMLSVSLDCSFLTIPSISTVNIIIDKTLQDRTE
jgi:hypothetical protein